MFKKDEMREKYTEVFLLDSYRNNGIFSREYLLNNDFNIIQNLIEQKKVKPESVGDAYLNILQFDIISKIMAYIEDLVIFSESFRTGKLFYEILDKEDVGNVIKRFFESLDSFSTKDFLKIMGYLDLEKENFGTNKDIVNKLIQSNITQIKYIFKIFSDFSITHHSSFRRLKHASTPITFGQSGFPFKKYGDFSSHSIISINEDALQKMKVIPFSEDVIFAYKVIAKELYKILKDIVTNRISKIHRQIEGVMPLIIFKPDDFSNDELRLLKKIIPEYYVKHSKIETSAHMNANINIQEDFKWYADLPEFVKSAKEMSRRKKEFQKIWDSIQ
ncbi:hypothetical protein [Nitrosopumilus adriaticus]|uniref:hypothetical protein n=1 Tax=Nitrosopumilus adriaticus TaxID=1580092 RepID=UPI00352E87D6